MIANLVRLAATALSLFNGPTGAAAEAQPSGCADPQYRQFDFWIGHWRVTEDGKLAGHNHIERVLDGCALIENWSSARGGAGKSLNFFDRDDGLWHQTWIDRSGGGLFLSGTFADGVMRLEGERRAAGEQPATRHRITWTALPDGSVRQLWESTPVGKSDWSRQFDGLYVREKPTRPADERGAAASAPRARSPFRICAPALITAISAAGMLNWIVPRSAEGAGRRFLSGRAGCATT